jgi:predicted ArsR family transcriptional regulator
MEAFDKGPYTRQTDSGIGHKGGASEDMANLLCGSKAAVARKIMLQTVLNEPLTAEEASRKAGLDPDYGSPRLSELIKKGLVAAHDRKGRSDRGNPCGRYIATDAGRAAA